MSATTSYGGGGSSICIDVRKSQTPIASRWLTFLVSDGFQEVEKDVRLTQASSRGKELLSWRNHAHAGSAAGKEQSRSFVLPETPASLSNKAKGRGRFAVMVVNGSQASRGRFPTAQSRNLWRVGTPNCLSSEAGWRGNFAEVAADSWQARSGASRGQMQNAISFGSPRCRLDLENEELKLPPVMDEAKKTSYS